MCHQSNWTCDTQSLIARVALNFPANVSCWMENERHWVTVGVAAAVALAVAVVVVVVDGDEDEDEEEESQEKSTECWMSERERCMGEGRCGVFVLNGNVSRQRESLEERDLVLGTCNSCPPCNLLYSLLSAPSCGLLSFFPHLPPPFFFHCQHGHILVYINPKPEIIIKLLGLVWDLNIYDNECIISYCDWPKWIGILSITNWGCMKIQHFTPFSFPFYWMWSLRQHVVEKNIHGSSTIMIRVLDECPLLPST